MIGTDLYSELLSRDCLTVLQTYCVRDLAAKSSIPDYAGWLDRVEQVPGVDSAVLSTVHGCLIALGMLKFEITGRSMGLQYQLSTSGREALTRTAAVPGDGSASEDDMASRDDMASQDDSASEGDMADAVNAECAATRRAA